MRGPRSEHLRVPGGQSRSTFPRRENPRGLGRVQIHVLDSEPFGTHNSLGIAILEEARLVIASEAYGDPFVHPQLEAYRCNLNQRAIHPPRSEDEPVREPPVEDDLGWCHADVSWVREYLDRGSRSEARGGLKKILAWSSGGANRPGEVSPAQR